MNCRHHDPNATRVLITSLESASYDALPNSVRHALREGADPNAIVGCRPAIVAAAKRGCTRSVRSLVEAGAAINCRIGGGTALHWALLQGYIDVAKSLIALGANPATPDSGGKPAWELPGGEFLKPQGFDEQAA